MPVVNVGGFSPSLAQAISSAPQSIIQDIVGVAAKVGSQDSLSASQTTKLERASLAVANNESGFTNHAPYFDVNGPSVGLFALHSLAVSSDQPATGGELADVPGSTLAAQEQNAENPVTNATVAISHIAAVLKQNPSGDIGQIVAQAQGPANPGAYASLVDSELSGTSLPGGGNELGQAASNPFSNVSPGYKVSVPSKLSGSSGTSSSSSSSSSSLLSTGNLMAKIGGFILALVLIGVGILVLFRPTTPGL